MFVFLKVIQNIINCSILFSVSPLILVDWKIDYIVIHLKKLLIYHSNQLANASKLFGGCVRFLFDNEVAVTLAKDAATVLLAVQSHF